MQFPIKRIWVFAAALGAMAAPMSGASAQNLTATDYVGRWTGETDWRGVEGFDSVGSWWQFAPDGTFTDNGSESGTWSVGSDGYITFTYAGGGNSVYTGTIIGPTLLGTMTNGSYTGVFALHR